MEKIDWKDLLPYVKIGGKELKEQINMVNEIIDLYNEKFKKLRYDLFPWNVLESVVKVITKGANKYGVDNWKTIDSNIFEGAMWRHYIEYKKGNHIDKQWNLPHLAHFVCNAVFLLWKELLIIEIEKRGELKSIEASKEKGKGGKK